MEDKIKYCHVPLEGKSFFFDHVHIVWDEQISFHQHAEWELSYIVKGSGTRIVGDVAETFSQGEIVFIPPNIPHCWSFNEYDHDEEGKIENITIIFPGSLLENCAGLFPEMESCTSTIIQKKQAIKFEGQTLKALQKTMTAMVLQNDVEQVSSLFNLFYTIASSNETRVAGHSIKQHKSTEKIQDIYRFVLNHYHRKVTLDDVAKFVGMNRSSFCTFFKRVKGKSFFTELNTFRVESSCQMLRETSLPISDICFAVGFEDVPYYNRTFKKLKGETPTAYRKKQQRRGYYGKNRI